ncbi:AIPR family protein [Cobetia marina]|uniref:AIPR family protein n=1 Tax=Cobetia marina TaxID=28258 RepID=UPI001142F77D|nr:AIPR family protein [Cobetia marina]GED43620.1 hypothetical protein HHA02_29490 [Cobetia marina]
MDKITSSLLHDFVVQNELERLNESTQFEHFVNYSITSKHFRGSFELDSVHSGSGGDCAIDGVFITVNGRMIIEPDELNDLAQTSGHIDVDIHFVQSKTSSSFNGSHIGSFVHGVKDFLSDEPKLVQNEKIQKTKTIWDAVISLSSYMINRRPLCKLFYVCTGKWVEDINLKSVIESGEREIDAIGLFEQVKLDPLGASELQRLFHETKNKLAATINFQNRVTLPDINGVSEAYLGVIPFDEYLKLVQDENETVHSIFDDNVRDFQGGNTVNKKIRKTLEAKDFDLFCVLNNGVTIVATSITPAGNRFTIRDYQVVNGCQTSHVLHDCRNIEGINQVFVPIKIIVTENEDIKTNITLATNSQTEVKTEQLEALSLFQKRLELYFSAEKTTAPLYYERRSQQYNSNSAIKRTQIISIPIQIKSFASMFLNSPHLVTGYYGTIVKRFSGKIFNDDHKYSPYYVSALCYFRIEQYFRGGDLKVSNKKARFHIMFLVRLLCMGEILDSLGSNKVDKECESFKMILLNDAESLAVFKEAEYIFENSELDMNKKQYKSESETELLISAYKSYRMNNDPVASSLF